MKLVKEVPFGRGIARLTVEVTEEKFLIDGMDFGDTKTKETKKIEIVANGNVVATDGVAIVVEDNAYWRNDMIRSGLDLNKQYSKVGKAMAEGKEAAELIKSTLKEMEKEVADEMKVETESQKQEKEEVEEAKEVIELAEKEGIENLMTVAEIKEWEKKYSAINNEGGEGYIPTRISKEAYQKALEVLK